MEWKGDLIIALCSKTYIALDEKQRMKISAKGINHASLRADNPLQKFQKVLHTSQPESGTNKGFRALHGEVYTYAQKKQCLPYFYCKRYVHDDGIFTSTLDLTLKPVPKKYASLQTDVMQLCPDAEGSFDVDNTTFHSIRQALVYHKHLSHTPEDDDKLKEILECHDKYTLTRHCRSIPNHYVWLQSYKEIVEKILLQRMEQNPDLKKALLKTNSEKLLNTDESDNLGGTGNNACTTRWWADIADSGRNIIGETYMQIRKRYKEEECSQVNVGK